LGGGWAIGTKKRNGLLRRSDRSGVVSVLNQRKKKGVRPYACRIRIPESKGHYGRWEGNGYGMKSGGKKKGRCKHLYKRNGVFERGTPKKEGGAVQTHHGKGKEMHRPPMSGGCKTRGRRNGGGGGGGGRKQKVAKPRPNKANEVGRKTKS